MIKPLVFLSISVVASVVFHAVIFVYLSRQDVSVAFSMPFIRGYLIPSLLSSTMLFIFLLFAKRGAKIAAIAGVLALSVLVQAIFVAIKLVGMDALSQSYAITSIGPAIYGVIISLVALFITRTSIRN